MNRYRNAFVFLILAVVSLNFTSAQTNDNNPFETDFTKEAMLFGTGAVAGFTALAMLFSIDPLNETELSSFDPLDVNEFDRIAIGKLDDDHLGDALLWGSYLLPLTFLADEQARSDFGDLALMYGEVLLLNASINGIVKGLTKRVRPFVYDEQSSFEEKTTVNARLSFYSGHVSISASNSFFTAAVLNEYVTNGTTRALIWSAAVVYPAIVGFERIVNHWHFPTDVIVGYIVGAAIGYLIPLIHKTGNEEINPDVPAENFYNPLIGFKINF